MALTAAMWRRIGAVTGWVVGSTAAVTGAAVVGTAAYFGRRVLTPDAVHPDDCELLAVDTHLRTVTLAANPGHVHAFDIESGQRLNDKPVVSA